MSKQYEVVDEIKVLEEQQVEKVDQELQSGDETMVTQVTDMTDVTHFKGAISSSPCQNATSDDLCNEVDNCCSDSNDKEDDFNESKDKDNEDADASTTSVLNPVETDYKDPLIESTIEDKINKNEDKDNDETPVLNDVLKDQDKQDDVNSVK